MTSSVRRGQPWGRTPLGPPDAEVTGDDAALAAVAAARPGARVRLVPRRSDLALALGLPDVPAEPRVEVPVDGLALDHPPGLAVNAVVLGVTPDRLRWASRRWSVEVAVDGRVRFEGRVGSVVVASGQYLRGADLVPRGHPGDGRIEVQVYELRRRERRAMRRRLPSGSHVPHPRVHELSGRRVEVRAHRQALPLEADGHTQAAAAAVRFEVVSPAVWVLV